VYIVEDANVAAPKLLHHAGNAACACWRHEQMNMVRHEHVRMQCTRMAASGGAKMLQVQVSIAVREEAKPAVISPLDNVKRDAGEL
jgi:hypothetical protein